MGTVYIVATPIGNLEDITHRAVRILSEVHCILAEDTRHSRHLLDHLGISTRVETLHEHNEVEICQRWLDRVEAGQNIALISDAGTPLISDPGYKLVAEARKRNIVVVPVPGPSALIAALSVGGLPTDRFLFEGFLPSKQVAREKVLAGLKAEVRTLVFYEAPHRLLVCLEHMQSVFGADRQAAVARELTKLHEEVASGTLESLCLNPPLAKGEIVILVAGSSGDAVNVDQDKLLIGLLAELAPSKAAALAAELTGLPRKQLYARAMVLKEES